MKNLWLIRIMGIVLFIAGFWLNYIIARRKFNRRAITGIELFSSYEKALATTAMEKLGRILAWLLILAGVFAFVLTLT